MRCRYVKQKLDRYIQGDLPGSISDKIQLHLHKCNNCAHTLSRINKLDGIFENTPLPPVPEDFSERLMQRARQMQCLQQVPGPVVVRLWEWFGRTSLKKSVAAAVLVVGLAIGTLMGWDTWQSPDVQSVGDSRMAQVEPTAIYNLDYLTSAPKGSPTDAYLMLVSATNGRER